jgi:hypothetical protein
VAQDRISKLEHPSTHKFPEWFPIAPVRGRGWR